MKIVQRWKDWAYALRLESLALLYAYQNPGTPWYAKAWGAVVAAYAFSPIDLIPDFIPVLGLLDDLILVPLGVAIAARLIPPEILAESRKRAREKMDRSKPVNWIAGGIIIALWAALAAFLAIRFLRIFSMRKQ